jgi:hypothetical protein
LLLLQQPIRQMLHLLLTPSQLPLPLPLIHPHHHRRRRNQKQLLQRRYPLMPLPLPLIRSHHHHRLRRHVVEPTSNQV